MKIIIALCLGFLMVNVVQAENGSLSRTEYVYVDNSTYSFGYRSETSQTFIYETRLDGERVRRFEFNLNSFPFKQTFEIPVVSNPKDTALKAIKANHKKSNVIGNYLDQPTQSFELSVVETWPGVFDTSFTLNQISGYSATTIEESNYVVALVNTKLHSQSGSSLRRGEFERHGEATPQGWKESIWYFED